MQKSHQDPKGEIAEGMAKAGGQPGSPQPSKAGASAGQAEKRLKEGMSDAGRQGGAPPSDNDPQARKD